MTILQQKKKKKKKNKDKKPTKKGNIFFLIEIATNIFFMGFLCLGSIKKIRKKKKK